MLYDSSLNVAEAIPYKDFKDRVKKVNEELKKNRYIEVWDKFIYSVEKWKEEISCS